MTRSALRIAVAMLLLALPGRAKADEPTEPDEPGARLVWFPGASRAIGHYMSASRDTALLGMQILPYPSGSAGADLAILALHKGGWSIRYGGFAMVELHSAQEYSIAAAALWRGLFGASLAVSADRLAKRWLPGDRGKLEATVSVRHESEHESVGTISPKQLGVGITGNFVMPDLAARIGIGDFDLELRGQTKIFLPENGYPPVVEGQPGRWRFVLSPIYEVGPGGDVVWRWRVHPRAHPCWSTFVEYLVGREVNALVDSILAHTAPRRIERSERSARGGAERRGCSRYCNACGTFDAMGKSRRLIFKEDGGEVQMTGMSVDYFWDLVEMVRADPDRQVPYELRFRSYEEDVEVSYVEDPISECSYAVVSGNDMERTCARVEAKTDCWQPEEMLAAWECAETDTDRILAILRIGVGAPYEYDESVATKLKEGLADDDEAVREAALAAIGYRDWRELDEDLKKIQATDPATRCRNRAAMMVALRAKERADAHE